MTPFGSVGSVVGVREHIFPDLQSSEPFEGCLCEGVGKRGPLYVFLYVKVSATIRSS